MPYFLAELWKTPLRDLEGEALWSHYEQCLIAHDWTYDFSDDHGQWQAGRDQASHLRNVRELCEKADKGRAEKLYHKHSFWHNDDGSLVKY